MEAATPASWIENARTAARILDRRFVKKPEKTAGPDFPDVTAAQAGLRSLEQTQSLEALETKGWIIDRFL